MKPADNYFDLNEVKTKILSLIKSNSGYNIETLMKLTIIVGYILIKFYVR